MQTPLLCLYNINTRRTLSRREDGGVVDEIIPLRGEQSPIANKMHMNEAVPPRVLQIRQVPQGYQAHNFEEDMSNLDIS